MFSKKTKIAIAFSAFVGLTILREMGWLDYNLFRSKIQTDIHRTSQSTTTTIKPSLKLTGAWLETINGRCNFGGSIANVPVLIVYENQHYGDTSRCSSLTVQINNLEIGSIWMPLYKSGNIHGTANCTGTLTLLSSEEKNWYKKPTIFQIFFT